MKEKKCKKKQQQQKELKNQTRSIVLQGWKTLQHLCGAAVGCCYHDCCSSVTLR